MIFKVIKKSDSKGSLVNRTAYLINDNWNDWFQYSTMYDLEVVDDTGELKYIGKVKIGEFSMDKDQGSPNIPNEFYKLQSNFFSLGQGDYYYENLNELGSEIREEILVKLNDIALNDEILNEAIKEDVTRRSLLRDISLNTVKIQYRRIANGGARLTDYKFEYEFCSSEDNSNKINLSFEVIHESNPPTNVHVIIGRNGVGKTRLIKNMIKTTINKSNCITEGNFSQDISSLFTNVICIAFSAFDEFTSLCVDGENENKHIPFINIGLPLQLEEIDGTEKPRDRVSLLTKEFVKSADKCIHGAKYNLWNKIIKELESDPIFKSSGVRGLKEVEKKEFESVASKVFGRLSSGHKIILLTITRLVETVEEKSLIFLDEPEGHLHPPLLSTFVRALSELLINRNGVAIVATHSPVVLQEVARKCVWKLRRSGTEAAAERLNIESFGENIDILTREVFRLEVTNSGFHKLLNDCVNKYKNYEDVINYFNGELGVEAKSIIKTLIAVQE